MGPSNAEETFENLAEILEEVEDEMPDDDRFEVNDLIMAGRELKQASLSPEDIQTELGEISDEMRSKFRELGLGERVSEMESHWQEAYAVGANPNDGWLPEPEYDSGFNDEI